MKQFSSPWLQRTSNSGSPLTYGRVTFFKEPGLAVLITYKDQALTIPHPAEIRADGNGVFPPIFMPSGYYTYTVEVRDRHNVHVDTASGQEAPDGATAPTSSSDEITGVSTTPYTILTTDLGKLVNFTPSGASIVTELIDAADYEDREITLRHGGDSYFVIVTTAGSDLINSDESLFLRPGDVVKLKSNGSNWFKLYHFESRLPAVVVVKSRTTTTLPGSPAAGDVYIGTSSPPSVWTANYLNIYDGYSEWHAFAPYEGQAIIVLDETINSRPKEYNYFNGAWRIKSSVLKSATFAIETTSGTASQDTAVDTWNQLFLNTTRNNDIDGLTLVGGALRFATSGKNYQYELSVAAFETGETRAGMSEIGDTSTRQVGIGVDAPLNSGVGDDVVMIAAASGTFEVGTDNDEWKAELYSELAGKAGKPQTIGTAEVYAILTLRELEVVS